MFYYYNKETGRIDAMSSSNSIINTGDRTKGSDAFFSDEDVQGVNPDNFYDYVFKEGVVVLDPKPTT